MHLTSRMMLGVLAFTLIVVLQYSATASPTEVNSVEYTVFYDPFDNTGVLRVDVSISATSGQVVSVELPVKVFIDSSLEYINSTVSPTSASLVVDYDDSTGYLSIMAENASSITVFFSVTNLTYESSPGSYIATLDLLDYSGWSGKISVELYLTGVFNATVYPRGAEYSVGILNNVTYVKIEEPAMYFMVFTVPINTPGTGAPSGARYDLFMVLVITILVVVAGIAVLLLWRMRRGVGLEKISATDVLSDPVARTIIRALGEAGENGLTQAELTSKTGIPKSSISRRVRRLEEEGYLAVARAGKYNYLRLTSKGWEAYRKIVEKKK